MRRPIAACLALGFFLALAGQIARAAADIPRPDVLAWDRLGVWNFDAFFEGGTGPMSDSGSIVFSYVDQTNSTKPIPGLVAGAIGFDTDSSTGTLIGTTSGKGGRRLKGTIKLLGREGNF